MMLQYRREEGRRGAPKLHFSDSPTHRILSTSVVESLISIDQGSDTGDQITLILPSPVRVGSRGPALILLGSVSETARTHVLN